MAYQDQPQKRNNVINIAGSAIHEVHVGNVDQIQAQIVHASNVTNLHMHEHYHGPQYPQQGLNNPTAGTGIPDMSNSENMIDCGHYKIIYDVDQTLGERVYVGRIISAIKDKKEYAVKLRIIDRSVCEPELRKKYLEEIEIGNQLEDHVNIARYKNFYIGAIAKEHTLVLVTQLCRNEKLENLLPEFTFEKKKILIVQLCHGLRYIHDNRIAHRDLKPSNVLLSLDGKHIKIIDFGISKEFALDENNTVTTSSGFSGSYGWVASEMCSDDRSKEFEAWVKADIHSLGLLIYFIFTDGKHPYGGDRIEKHQSIRNKEQPDFSVIECNREFHERYLLIDLLKDMLSHEPDARPGITEILQHCVTWSEEKKMSFIKDCHRYFDQHCDEDRKKPKRKAIRHLKINGTVEQRMAYVDRGSIGSSVYSNEPTRTEEEQKALERIHEVIGENCVKLIKEKLEDPRSESIENSFTELVRYIRNTHEYYYKKPEEVKSKLGSRNEGMWNFIASNFPEFFIYLFHLVKNELKGDDENRYLQEEAKNCELPQK